jgi:hypothetical protein
MQDHASPSGAVSDKVAPLETELATHVRQLHAALDAIARRLGSEALDPADR